jgi:DNA-binding response OmpR family regulator
LISIPVQLIVEGLQTESAPKENKKLGDNTLNITKKRILVVDDDTGILRVFKQILEKEGYTVETAETGKDAQEKMQKEKFDVCLVDVRLPDMDGTDLLLKLAGSPQTIKIIVTGYSSEETGKKAADYGADDFLVKPVKPDELIATVKERLETAQQADQDVSS